jgi:hypothetical protein
VYVGKQLLVEHGRGERWLEDGYQVERVANNSSTYLPKYQAACARPNLREWEKCSSGRSTARKKHQEAKGQKLGLRELSSTQHCRVRV